jgi:putative DNA primase/helicase
MSGATRKDLQRASGAMPSVRLLRGDAVALEPVRWLWRCFLPAGMLTILGGAPGCGKTTIALSLAATVTRSGQWPDGTRCTRPGDVIVWSGEDPPAVTAARLTAAGADMTRVHFIDGVSGGEEFDPGRDMSLLESTVQRLSAPRLLILDPIVSAVAGDSHKGAEVRRSLQPVVDLAHRLGCAVLGITHFSKGTAGRDPIERVTGSIAFAALARLVLVAAKVKPEPGDEGESRRVLLRAKSNIGPDDGGFAYALERVEVAPQVEGQRVRWLDALQGTARELLAEAESEPESDEAVSTSDDAAGFLRDVLKGTDSTPSKDAIRKMKAEGYTDKVIRRAREKLGVIVKREGFGADMRSLWSLPIVPTVAHSCPPAPTQRDGQQWARMAREGTNDLQADDAEVL